MLDKNKIYNLDLNEGLSLLNENSVDLVVTSPPYNVGVKYDSWNDLMSSEDYFHWVTRWMKLIHRCLKPDGRIAINIPYETNFTKSGGGRNLIMANYHSIMIEAGLKFAGLVDLEEDSPQRIKKTAWGSWLSPSAPYIYNPKECVLIFYKDVWKKQSKGESFFDNSDKSKQEFMELVFAQWKYKAETRGLTQANFSLDIPEKAIKILSWKGDLVVDPFMGSGTTALACKKLDRYYIGFDISKNYVEIAERRING